MIYRTRTAFMEELKRINKTTNIYDNDTHHRRQINTNNQKYKLKQLNTQPVGTPTTCNWTTTSATNNVDIGHAADSTQPPSKNSSTNYNFTN